MMFKRAGRGHERGGIEKTPVGACAVRCPACPDTKMNLVPDWATRPFQYVSLAVGVALFVQVLTMLHAGGFIARSYL